MSKRNSALQEAIIESLADGMAAPAREIFTRLGVTAPTPAMRVTLSRALARLADKGLIEAWCPQRCRQGNGYLWQRKPNG
jgi:hypothetical protein